MQPLLVILCSIFLPGKQAYFFEGENIVFVYKGSVSYNAYVSGNFNRWCKDDPKWKLRFDEKTQAWKLTVPKKEIKTISGDFYEFTFRIDGVLVDADENHEDVIHCKAYGFRYVLKDI